MELPNFSIFTNPNLPHCAVMRIDFLINSYVQDNCLQCPTVCMVVLRHGKDMLPLQANKRHSLLMFSFIPVVFSNPRSCVRLPFRTNYTMATTRPVKKLFIAEPQSEGRGARVRRSIGSGSCRQFDPFLLLDEFSVRKPAGFPKYVQR